MKEPKFSAKMETVGETLLQLKKIKRATEKLLKEHETWLSQMAADCGYTGKWESSLLPGSITVYKTARLVNERDCLTKDEQTTLIGRRLLKRRYSVVTEKLEELLDEKQINALVDGGALKETYKTVGGGCWDAVPVAAKSLERESDFVEKIESCVNENIMEWANPLLRSYISSTMVWMGSTKHDEASSNLQPVIEAVVERIANPRVVNPDGEHKEDHCEGCGVIDASVTDVSGETSFFNRLCGSCEEQLCENCHQLGVGPLKTVESEGYTQDWCEDCWEQANTQTLVEDMRDAEDHLGYDPEEYYPGTLPSN